jgi:hypothetical protein
VGEARRAKPNLMPTIASSELPVPKSWDEFEDICADLFGRIWNDHNTVRYSRLEAAIENFPRQRFTLRKGILVIREHVCNVSTG